MSGMMRLGGRRNDQQRRGRKKQQHGCQRPAVQRRRRRPTEQEKTMGTATSSLGRLFPRSRSLHHSLSSWRWCCCCCRCWPLCCCWSLGRQLPLLLLLLTLLRSPAFAGELASRLSPFCKQLRRRLVGRCGVAGCFCSWCWA